MEILKLFKQIQGPYSIIIYYKKTDSIYFARDSLGRQTLLIGNELDAITITSVTGYYLK